MRVLAVDFGTSNTVAMIRHADGQTQPLLFDGSPLLPSAVHSDAYGKVTGERYIAFTGGLLDVLRGGVPGAGEPLRLGDLHSALLTNLVTRNRPRPRQQGSDTVAFLALTRNPAAPFHALER